ncbi:hypothetical protein [Rhizobium leguminosarum]|uniref:hypothetical protein n=1 Tax=Rhizobium leguminosarum TaxID=384 RepID=UPI003F96C33D
MADSNTHHLWEIYPVATLHDSDHVVPAWGAFIDFWNDTLPEDVPPGLSEAFRNDRNQIQLATLVRWWWIDDECDDYGQYQYREFSEWPWFEEGTHWKQIPDGSLFLTFYNTYNGSLDKFMVRVSREDEESVKTWLKEQLDFITQNLWYPIQTDGKIVVRVDDNPLSRNAAVQLWSD